MQCSCLLFEVVTIQKDQTRTTANSQPTVEDFDAGRYFCSCCPTIRWYDDPKNSCVWMVTKFEPSAFFKKKKVKSTILNFYYAWSVNDLVMMMYICEELAIFEKRSKKDPRGGRI